MGVSRAFVFLLGAVLGGGLLFALLYPWILALEGEVGRLKGEVKGLSFRLEAQKAENRALREEARRAHFGLYVEACPWTPGPFLWRRRHGARTAFPAQETPRGG